MQDFVGEPLPARQGHGRHTGQAHRLRRAAGEPEGRAGAGGQREAALHPAHHGQSVLGDLWELGQAIRNQQVIEIGYERMKEPKLVQRRVQPVGIMFSEYYFYLTAFLEDKTDFDNPDDLFPTIYRIDRIRSVKVLNEHFRVPYARRFEEGEFRKRVQFMYGGRLEHIRFRYTGPSLEAVLDRLPTAQVLSEDADGWLISAEVFGKGIEMWLKSQGTWVTTERESTK